MAGMSKEQQVESWNIEHPVGSKVVVTRDNEEMLETTVKYPAQLLGGHSPVAWVDGISGCYDLCRITSFAPTMPERSLEEGGIFARYPTATGGAIAAEQDASRRNNER